MIKDKATDEQIHKGRRERLRQRLENFGLDSFNEHEVLEFALGFCFKRCDTNPTAHRLINKFGNLYNTINARIDELVKVEGVGESAAYFLSFLKSFTNYYNVNGARNVKKIESTNQALDYIIPVTDGLAKEQFYVICLGSGNKVLHAQKVATGTANKVFVDIRNTCEVVLRFVNTVSVILAHNHPMGQAIPSVSDNRITKLLVGAFLPLNIDVTDHIIIGENKSYYSYYKSGELDAMKKSFMQDHQLTASSTDNKYE
ncbi:MAG: hypothetical protein FWD32_00335 [Firmicutes bacterium]|nr:hypothetical protein [Bacillota bacterium]